MSDDVLPSSTCNRYEYKLIPVSFIREVSRIPVDMPDAYHSAELIDPKSIVNDLLSKGYRWIRTEGDDAIMEKVTSIETSLPQHDTPTEISVLSQQ